MLAQACERKQWKESRLLFIHVVCDALLAHSSRPLGLKSISEVNPNGGGDLDAAPVSFVPGVMVR